MAGKAARVAVERSGELPRYKAGRKSPHQQPPTQNLTTEDTEVTEEERTAIRKPGKQEKSDRIYKILQNYGGEFGFLYLDHVDSVNSVSVQSRSSPVRRHLSLFDSISNTKREFAELVGEAKLIANSRDF